MKKICIVYSQPLLQIQGINYVNNSFVMGGKYFREHNLVLSKIFATDVTFDCVSHDRIDMIGSDVGTSVYNRKRKARHFFNKCFPVSSTVGGIIRTYINDIINPKKTVDRIGDDVFDYIIFQDIHSVIEYYKRYKHNKNYVKSILILHCSDDPLEQAVSALPGYYKHRFLKKLAYKRCEKAMKLADKVVYLSEHALNQSPLSDNDKTYIFNGIEDDNTIKVVPPHKPLQLVCVGSVSYRKGQINLIEAISLLDESAKSQIHLTIVGGGSEFEQCRNLVKNKQLEDVVTMTGPRNDVADILKDMDVFLLPSEAEGMPMSILEAMRQGLYIMASETGGIPEMISEEYGELISRDYSQLAYSIKRVIGNSIVTLETKQKSRERFIKDFTLKSMIEKYSLVLCSL